MKPKKKFIDLNSYKRYEGERGSPESWKAKVEKLLGRALSVDESLAVLGLDVLPKTHQELKKAYRKAIMKAHPDKGGSAEEAARINQAYTDLSLKLRG